MELEKAIEQLKELKLDRESFITGDEDHDKIYKDDIEAIETVLTELQKYIYTEQKIYSCGVDYGNRDYEVIRWFEDGILTKEEIKQYFEKKVEG